MEKTVWTVAAGGGAVLVLGALLVVGVHVLPEQAPAPLRSVSEAPRTPFLPRFEKTPEPDDFRGVTATAGDWRLQVTGVHVDGDGILTSGAGEQVRAPAGMTYHVFTLRVVNRGTEPSSFAPSAATAASVAGETFPNDPEAEQVVAAATEPLLLGPGDAADTAVVFAAPPDTRLYEIVLTLDYGAVFANLEARP